jgi:hypothetical protein
VSGRDQDLLQSPRETPSPTHHQYPQRPIIKSLGHRRQDSDTLRNASSLGSPTAVELPPRRSPSSRDRLSPPDNRLARDPAKHRRSPTALEPPTNGVSHNEGNFVASLGKSDDAVSSSGERVKTQMSLESQQKYLQAAGHAPPPPPAQLNRHMVVSEE